MLIYQGVCYGNKLKLIVHEPVTWKYCKFFLFVYVWLHVFSPSFIHGRCKFAQMTIPNIPDYGENPKGPVDHLDHLQHVAWGSYVAI